MKSSLKSDFSQIEPSQKEIQATRACITNQRRIVELDGKIAELERTIEREKR